MSKSNIKVIPRPKKSSYCEKNIYSELMNATSGTKKYVSFDRVAYCEHLERYANYLESLIEQIESKL